MYRSQIGRQHALHSAATTPDIDVVVDVVVIGFLVDSVNDVVVVNDDTEDDNVDIGDNVHADDVICDDNVV